MKVFVKASDLAGKEPPIVLAFYPDDSDVPDNAHGEGTTMVQVPATALITEPPEAGATFTPRRRLAPNWREQQKNYKPGGALGQIASVRDIVGLFLEHGGDVSKWPAAAKKQAEAFRKAR